MATWPPGSLDHGARSVASWPLCGSAFWDKETVNACPGLTGFFLLGKHQCAELLDQRPMSAELCKELPTGFQARVPLAPTSPGQPPPASPRLPPPPSLAGHVTVCCFYPFRLSRCVVARARDSPLCHSESPPVLQEHRLSPALRAAGGGGPALAEPGSCVPRISLPDEAEVYSWGCWGSA